MQVDLTVESVTKKFKEFVAVDEVSFEVQQGQFFSILGPSGCGKTTLLRMIAGFTEPTQGKIEIRGKNVVGTPPNKRPVNLIFQHLPRILPSDYNEEGKKKMKSPVRWLRYWSAWACPVLAKKRLIN